MKKKKSFLDELNNEFSPLLLESEVAGCMGAVGCPLVGLFQVTPGPKISIF